MMFLVCFWFLQDHAQAKSAPARFQVLDKFIFSVKGKEVKNCQRAEEEMALKFRKMKRCTPFKGEHPPLLRANGKCVVGKLTYYVFDTEKDCKESSSEMSDGLST